MNEVVIDTNILLVADGQHGDVSDDCVQACVERLLLITRSGTVVIDDAYRVLGEYEKKLDIKRGKRAGAAFLKWLAQNQANPDRVARVELVETDQNVFAEFPDAPLQDEFDPPDRKFVAISSAHPAHPPILQATDSKWLLWRSQLAAAGVRVEFLCPEDICRFFTAKFPHQALPALS